MVKVIRRNVQYPHNWPTAPATEKGIDVAIAVDMIRLAMEPDHMDAAILFSSDTDLLPALETIKDLDLCHIEVAAWAQSNRLRFDGTQTPWCHNINEEQIWTIEDSTDYAAHDYAN